jgi:hypothetical protein
MIEIENDGVSDAIYKEGDLSRYGSGYRHVTIARVALGHADTGGGVFAWQNPESVSIVISKVIVDVTTVATGACTVDVGAQATGATTSSDNLIDGIDVHTATGLLGQADGDGTTNSKLQQKLAAGKWVTGSKASGAAAGLAGFAYIHYHPI